MIDRLIFEWSSVHSHYLPSFPTFLSVPEVAASSQKELVGCLCLDPLDMYDEGYL